MRIGQIVLRLRAKNTSFGNFIGGSAELDTAIKNTLTRDMAFVIPLIDDAGRNNYDTTQNQRLIERFGVVVALANDSSQSDKLGFLAYDRLHNIRNELIAALVNWYPIGAECAVFYRGGRLVDMNNAYIWYQFEFEYESRIICDENGIAMIQNTVLDDTEEPVPFNAIYMQMINTPDARIPYANKFGEGGELPYDDSYPDVAIPDMANWIDLTVNPDAGAFTGGFQSGFDVDYD